MPEVTFDDVPFITDTSNKNTSQKVVAFDDVPFTTSDEGGKAKIVTFDDVPIVGDLGQPQKKLRGAGGSFENTGEIRQGSLAKDIANKVNRWASVIDNAVLGDIPYVRNLLPESIRGATPLTENEKRIAPLANIYRDISLYGKIGSLVEGAGALTGLTKAGEALTKAAPKVGRFASKLVPEVATGAGIGAATANTEKPKEIAQKAALYGALTGATVPAMEIAGYTGKKIASRLAKSKTLQGVGEWLGLRVRNTPVTKLVRQRYSQINSALIDSETFISGLQKQLSPEEEKWLPYLVEKKVPKAIADAIPSDRMPQLKELAGKVRAYLDQAHTDMMKQYGKDIGFIKDYIPHIWDIPKNKEKAVLNWFITRNPHLKQRLIPTIEEGIEKFGLTPKYEKITDLLRVYDQMRIKSAANVKFIQDLNKLKDETGIKMIMRADKAPADWKIIDHPAVRRAFGRMVGKEGEKKLMLSKMPIKVNPAIYDDVNAVLETYQPGKFNRVLDTINLLAKQSVLTFSLFHHTALTETAIATGMGKEVTKVWNPIKIIRAFKNGTYKEVLNRSSLAKMAVKDGLNIGAISDVEGGRTLVGVLKQSEKALHNGVAATGIKTFVRKPLEFNNKFLWDYLHTSYKLSAYAKLKHDMIKMFPEKSVETVGKEVAHFVNDIFGGQAWEILGKSPQWKLFSRYLLLSPDWTLSTMRQAVSPFGVGAASKTGIAIRQEMGKNFWRKAIVYFGGSMNLLNYAYTKAYTGRGRFMWDNPPGKKTYLFIGMNPDGTERYLRWGKQFREFAEAIKDPAGVAGRKISPLIRMTKSQIFPDKVWQKEIANNPFWSTAGLKARALQLAKDITPYSVTQQTRAGQFTPISFALPQSKGMTPYRLREGFKKAILTQNKNMAMEYWKAGLDNGLNSAAQFKTALSSVKSDQTFEAKTKAKNLINKAARLGKEKGIAEIKRAQSAGEISPAMAKQIMKIMREKASVAQQKREFYKWFDQLGGK